ncbi:PREDICTED: uncharacterized protein LOC108359465 [Rhagoletis zephyria]|uniref:uncharacterized protein LOC108359465 n=1 Tax=Rhagoletis zephyria TaxID=28612 RepID=UPI000811733F|nr:PREDICTED: uncharacterized protein LOC108359465 [Rhagoletis zephyria]
MQNCVWADQKKYVRQKVASNTKLQKGTGGGPHMVKVLSPLEEAIFKLIGMKQSVEGLPVKKFGLQENFNEICNENFCPEVELPNVTQNETLDESMVISEASHADYTTINVSLVSADSFEFVSEEASADNTEVPSTSKKASSSKKNFSKKERAELALTEEIKIQKEICANIKTGVANQDEHRDNLRKIYQRLDKIYDLKKKHFKAVELIKKEKLEEIKKANVIKREKLEEKKRHNYFIEEMRRNEIEHKIEKTKRLLEIQELKIYKDKDENLQC